MPIYNPSVTRVSAIQVLADTTLGAAAQSITFSNLHGNAAKGFMILFNLQNPTAGDALLSLYVNNDTTHEHYHRCEFYGSTTVSWSRDSGATARLAYLVAGAKNNGVIYCHRSPDGYFCYECYCNFSAQGYSAWIVTGIKDNATIAEITSIQIASDSANTLATGSEVIIYSLV